MASRPSRATTAGILLPGFVGHALPDWLAVRLRGGLAGVCLFGQNIVSAAQLSELTAAIRAANPLAVIAVDEEGGDVTRLHDRVGSPYPGNAILGRTDDVDYTKAIATTVGWELRRAGCTLDFAPDVDINSNPDNPVIGVRSFGTDPSLVARHSAAWVAGLQATGIAGSAKHFPGHGDTALDSHLALPVIDRSLDQLRDRELAPFVAAIAAGVRTIMTSHIMVPQLDAQSPATFSPTVLGDLLRRELGFDGVIVTDALDMAGASGEIGIPEAAVRAVAAGCDLLCIGTENTADQLDDIEQVLADAVASGRLDPGRLADASARVRRLARDSEEEARHIPLPAYEADLRFSLERTAASFDTAAFDTAAHRIEPDRAIVVLETEANIAVGACPWGPVAAGAEAIVVRDGETLHLLPGVQPVIVGRGNHRRAWVRSLIDEVRRQHPSTFVVEMGWPSDDRRYADVATFGASRHAGLALLRWLERRAGA
ncbi:beta-N-acetylhexosaminidase [Glaciihabitans sp. INWT7]|uniref:beta-N-acetylhexosaminidase n=1 Tax=Glaciihabitans sp. INWT7 TaxID=2596912 RepID=UPI0021040AAB|nr:beta-N-acetylhexosaminidase [Glaciihabitans sp. INWT7]